MSKNAQEGNQPAVQVQGSAGNDAVATANQLDKLTVPTAADILAIDKEVQRMLDPANRPPGGVIGHEDMIKGLKVFARENPLGLRLSRRTILLHGMRALRRDFGEDTNVATTLIDAVIMALDD